MDSGGGDAICLSYSVGAYTCKRNLAMNTHV